MKIVRRWNIYGSNSCEGWGSCFCKEDIHYDFLFLSQTHYKTSIFILTTDFSLYPLMERPQDMYCLLPFLRMSCSVLLVNEINLIIMTENYINESFLSNIRFFETMLKSLRQPAAMGLIIHQCYAYFWHNFAMILTLICLVFTQYTVGFISGGTSKRTFAMRTLKRGETCRAKRCTMARLMMGT